jgi:hypothetical protein
MKGKQHPAQRPLFDDGIMEEKQAERIATNASLEKTFRNSPGDFPHHYLL